MQLFSGIVTSLVEGELLQAEASLVQTEFSQTNATGLNWDVYLRKTELKAASMISTVLECAVILGGASESDPWRKIAYNYGLEFGMAFQVIVYIAFSEEYTNWECKANRWCPWLWRNCGCRKARQWEWPKAWARHRSHFLCNGGKLRATWANRPAAWTTRRYPEGTSFYFRFDEYVSHCLRLQRLSEKQMPYLGPRDWPGPMSTRQ